MRCNDAKTLHKHLTPNDNPTNEPVFFLGRVNSLIKLHSSRFTLLIQIHAKMPFQIFY